MVQEAMASDFGKSITSAYNIVLSELPSWIQHFINLFILVVLVAIYSIFVWKLYRFISHKNILSLNLNQYNNSQYPSTAKFFGSMFYFLEYIVVLPFLIFFWFAVFTLFLIFLNDNLNIKLIFLI